MSAKFQRDSVTSSTVSDVIVIGGGLAGLATSTFLARAGKSVMLVEQSSDIGGRARTAKVDGFYMNQGPHALYVSDVGAQVLKDLEVRYTGGIISYGGGRFGSGAYAVKGSNLYRIPTSIGTILSSKLLGFMSKIEFVRIFGALGKMDFTKIENLTIAEWVEQNIRNRDVADIFKAFLRLNTYSNDPDTQSAGSSMQQLSRAISGGTMYLDRGWQTLVDGLAEVAQKAGVRIATSSKVNSLEKQRSSVKWTVNLSGGENLVSDTVVLALGPREAHGLFKNGERPEVITKAAEESRPIRIASLDLALNSLPNKQISFALGIESPLYFSVHSAYAQLAPSNGSALVHVAKYLSTSIEPRPKEDEKELEDFLDLVQPGWRSRVVRKRFLPNLMVSNALVTALGGGLRGRPGPKIEDNLFIVGDWVGPAGLLSNASLASAKQAADEIIMQKTTMPV